jgi:hypothetical protein
MDFQEDCAEFNPDHLNTIFKEFTINIHSNVSANFCKSCEILMDYVDYCYVCSKCKMYWRVEGAGSISECMADDVSHNINVSSGGSVFHTSIVNTADARIRKKLTTLGKKLPVALHYDIIEKIFIHFKNIRSLNRAKIDWGLLALSTIEVCNANGVLISKDDIMKACDVKSDEFNHAKKISRNLQISNSSSGQKDETFEKLLLEVRQFLAKLDVSSEPMILLYVGVLQDIRISINTLEISSKYEWLILLYVKLHFDMSPNSHTQKSRIAGAVWYCIIKAKLNIGENPITEKRVESVMKVSISTFKGDLSKEINLILRNTENELLNRGI